MEWSRSLIVVARRLLLAAILLACSSSGLGCRHPSRSESRESWAYRLRGLRGQSQARVAEELGSPDSIEHNGHLEIWIYVREWREHTSTLHIGDSKAAIPWDHRDVVWLYFNSGVLEYWDTRHR